MFDGISEIFYGSEHEFNLIVFNICGELIKLLDFISLLNYEMLSISLTYIGEILTFPFS